MSSFRTSFGFGICAALIASLSAACGDSGTGGDGGGAAGGGATGGGNTGGGSAAQDLSGELDDMTLTKDTVYTLVGVVSVPAGKTLTIEPGTRIVGDKGSLGTLVVQRGGKLVAEGTKAEPIVFSSALPEGERGAGDWGGVVLLGRAPINEAGGEAEVEGFTDPQLYGGTDAADSSGSLTYVRIEFGGIEIAPDNEINGLTLAGVGHGTRIDFVQVKSTLDDCFEFFGGTVNVSHLVCYRNGDDGFDFDQGYAGKMQYLFLQQDPTSADDSNGFECDNDKDVPDVAPITSPTISNITLCGQNGDQAKQQYGFLFRRGCHGKVSNAVIAGFEAGVDFRDAPATAVDLDHSLITMSSVESIAYVEDKPKTDAGAPDEDDDGGFDEIGWFEEGAGNTTEGPDFSGCFAATPNPLPTTTIAGGTPGAGLDTTATFVGAFKDSGDDWLAGWTDWSAN